MNIRGVFRVVAKLFLVVLSFLRLEPVSGQERLSPLSLRTSSLGVMGTGSKMFRCGLSHSSGAVYLGTYGPQPAIVWKYDPTKGTLENIGEPGEYQLDSMVEAPDGAVYIGTAYEGLVYRLDPSTGLITSLGSPPIDSTSWIFTMIRTRSGEIYGAKGVGLFKLDWKAGRFETLGVVPGDHRTEGPNASAPITRQLQEDGEGVLWGDTNRWLFRFDPQKGRIEPLVDMALVDPNCYALFLPVGTLPFEDPDFVLFSRFSGKEVRHFFYTFRKESGKAEPLEIEGLKGRIVGHPLWWESPRGYRLLACETFEDHTQLLVIDTSARRVEEVWTPEAGTPITPPLAPLAGPGLYFHTPTQFLQAEPSARTLRLLATNPTPAESRCLAISPQGVLGSDTWDCGHAFTLDTRGMERKDHGRVWIDDHRCNYGPAAFAGLDGRYFVANHSQQMQSLWVTDTLSNKHWRIGASASQLTSFSDGTVWGVYGPNPNRTVFDREAWRPSFQNFSGEVFRYMPGAEEVEVFDWAGSGGPLCEAPLGGGRALVAHGKRVRLIDPNLRSVVAEAIWEATLTAVACDRRRGVAYFADSSDRLVSCLEDSDGKLRLTRIVETFGARDRGFFVLPRSGRVVGIAEEGTLSIYDTGPATLETIKGPAPLPAGPAVDPEEDVWYFADTEVTRYLLE